MLSFFWLCVVCFVLAVYLLRPLRRILLYLLGTTLGHAYLLFRHLTHNTAERQRKRESLMQNPKRKEHVQAKEAGKAAHGSAGNTAATTTTGSPLASPSALSRRPSSAATCSSARDLHASTAPTVSVAPTASISNGSTAGSPVTGSAVSHTRMEQRQSDDDARKQRPSDTHGSPAMRLYRDALGSIFSMLDLQDLSRALSVSRSWSAAVRSMKPVGVTIDRNEDQLKRQEMLRRPLPTISVDARTSKPSRSQSRVDQRDGEKETAQSSAHVSPAMGLYRHALESIFAMLQLEDLSRVLAVSRSWSAAVISMKSIDATIEHAPDESGRLDPSLRPLPPIDCLVASPLLRHLAAMHVKDSDSVATPLSSQSLALLLQHAPHLTSLWCNLPLAPAAPLTLPAQLTSLQLQLDRAFTAAEINAVLTALAALPSLSCLTLEATVDGVDLSLLAASRTLSDLMLRDWMCRCPTLSDAQIKQVRSSLSHLTRIHVVCLKPANLARLLPPPVSARWQDIGLIFADEHTGELLVTLPTLTKLDLIYGSNTPHADFLSQLPLLSALTLDCGRYIPAASLLASLLPCCGLTELELELRGVFDAAQVSALLAALTNLRALKLRCTLQSLQCFASPATRPLESLYFAQWGLPLPPSELAHLYALQGLRSLELSNVFESLDDAALQSLTPPTARLPRLTRFAHTSTGWIQARVERTGPSFEWMQQRRTQ